MSASFHHNWIYDQEEMKKRVNQACTSFSIAHYQQGGRSFSQEERRMLEEILFNEIFNTTNSLKEYIDTKVLEALAKGRKNNVTRLLHSIAKTIPAEERTARKSANNAAFLPVNNADALRLYNSCFINGANNHDGIGKKGLSILQTYLQQKGFLQQSAIFSNANKFK